MRRLLELLLAAAACSAAGDEVCASAESCVEGTDAAGGVWAVRVLPYGAVAGPRFPAPHYAQERPGAWRAGTCAWSS
ncbi:unnamed protein product [Prorocentrum cordatum]|uniref:Uncharacterized protein n=1 Tax=Prorocentrum cordatum TaxID=2364126 RepID=A0ABN9TGM1_9DINO|nr:unnamed protein product [Polarella glacialis]